MPDGFSVDSSELNALAADLDAIAGDIEKPLKQALNVTAFKVKKAAQTKVRGRKHFAQAAAGIDFDVTARKGEVEAEIGYSKDRREVAKLGNLVEFGAPGSPNALTPGNELQSSLHENEADFAHGIERAIGDSLKKAGL